LRLFSFGGYGQALAALALVVLALSNAPLRINRNIIISIASKDQISISKPTDCFGSDTGRLIKTRAGQATALAVKISR